MKPIEGAESGGALGFFKGMGKGLVGYVLFHHSVYPFVSNSMVDSVVTKPVVGVFDLASNVTEGDWHVKLFDSNSDHLIGIRNTTTVFDSPERDRVRLVGLPSVKHRSFQFTSPLSQE
jgi:vacuolar protein sorting-associated protein 13A/C